MAVIASRQKAKITVKGWFLENVSAVYHSPAYTIQPLTTYILFPERVNGANRTIIYIIALHSCPSHLQEPISKNQVILWILN
jgi:hypothetical protein